jgi:hypothetical protein
MRGTSITHATGGRGILGGAAVDGPHEVVGGASGGGPTTADGASVPREAPGSEPRQQSSGPP